MLILLDIDGVMVQGTSWRPLEILKDGFPSFTNMAISNLKRIIAETKGSIMLTTSHKSTYNITQWQEIFKYRGIDVQLSKLEDNINHLTRKDEILSWIGKSKNTANFVIIDDDKTLNDLPMQIKQRLVLTSSFIGLTSEGASSAIEILKRIK